MTGPLPPGSRKDSKFFQAGAYLQHIASGLFVHAAYGHENNSDTTVVVGTPAAQVTPPDSNLDQVGPNALGLGIESSTFRRSGGTIAQEIDAASMTMYLKYEHYEADVSGANLNANVKGLQDADFVSVGALINF